MRRPRLAAGVPTRERGITEHQGRSLVSAADTVIIDSGGANLASLQFAFERLGARTHVTTNASEIGAAARVVLPGVGAAANAMQRLRNCGVAALLPTLK